MRRISTLIAIWVVVGGLLLALVDAARADGEMSQQRAANYYLKAVCRAADAGDAYNRTVFHGQHVISVAEVKRRLPEIKAASRKYATALFRFARQLMNPPADWPGEVARLVYKYGDLYTVYANIRDKQGRAQTQQEWTRLDNKAYHFSFGNYSAKIRVRLDLPPPGRGCN
jgi:hypothetical protein